MADSKELRAIVGAMTALPWVAHHTGACLESPSQEGDPHRMSVVLLGANEDANQRGIRALANHAPALVELIAAAELVAGARLGGSLELALSELDAALAAVHAVGKGAT